MAILFVSPKKRQRKIFWSISLILILILFAISLIIFPPQFINRPQISPEELLGESLAKINFNIMDSNQVKNLESFGDIKIEFNYIAKDNAGRQVAGKISAVNRDEAMTLLTKMGFRISNLKESEIGRSEPFIPYYQPTAKVNTKK